MVSAGGGKNPFMKESLPCHQTKGRRVLLQKQTMEEQEEIIFIVCTKRPRDCNMEARAIPKTNISGFRALMDHIDWMMPRGDTGLTVHTATGTKMPRDKIKLPWSYLTQIGKITLPDDGDVKYLLRTRNISGVPWIQRAYLFEDSDQGLVFLVESSQENFLMKRYTPSKDSLTRVRNQFLANTDHVMDKVCMTMVLADYLLRFWMIADPDFVSRVMDTNYERYRLFDHPLRGDDTRATFTVSSTQVFTLEKYMETLVPAIERMSNDAAEAMLKVVRETREFQQLPSLALLHPDPRNCDPAFLKDLFQHLDTHLTTTFHRMVQAVCQRLDIDPQCFKDLFQNTLPEVWREALLSET